ncbi:hypothetical protein [Kaistella sp.]|uniref:hypothetical protein n=1 Tax=Kaistella sp. TaxID=2782235 RepID=UPI002F942D84
MKKIIYTMLITLLASCTKEKPNSQPAQNNSADVPVTGSLKSVREPIKQTKENILKNLNTEIISSLKSNDYTHFSQFIHPHKGIRFSMYAYVQPEKDKHFSREDFNRYISMPTKFTWGEKDGTGDLLVVSLQNYLQQWVFKRDFTQAQFYLNEFKGKGNSLNNLLKIYPNADFTENYIPGSEKYSGMDWNSLRFVFEEFQGEYYLVAVINDEWTV